MNKRWLLVLAFTALAGCATKDVREEASLDRIANIVVILPREPQLRPLVQHVPGANGVANATAEQKTQLDHDGKPLPHLPPVYNAKGNPDIRYPLKLSNGPFRIETPPIGKRMDEIVPSPLHRFWHNKEQINGGRNNMFVAMSNTGSWAMGYSTARP